MSNDVRLRRTFALWFGLGCGAAGVVASRVTLHWEIPDDVSTHVSAAASGWPVPVLIALLLTGSAVTVGTGTYLAARRVAQSRERLLPFALTWAGVAMCAAGLNVYLAYFPLEFEQLPAPSLRQHLLITLPMAGLTGGLVSSLVLGAPASRIGLSAGVWAIAMLLPGVFAVPLIYLGVGGSIDAFERAGLGASAGHVVGFFLSSLLMGYLAAALGAVATVPALRGEQACRP
ncbi:MAG TPA: hypothetical protein VN700_02585 [Vicinamibacterales bacterium]|nr:hypothetical protein [Vicinamibacterales bacterium]